MSEERFTSVFDIIGPVMVGPSSSHTAGAARIGKVVSNMFGERPEKVIITLYESFAKTYRGHGTDMALIGGLLGMDTDDIRLPESIALAEAGGMDISFIPSQEKANHPNTVKLEVFAGDRELSVVGSSIGGGKIQITEINGFAIKMEEGQPTFLIVHQDVPGMVAHVSNILLENAINISTMSVSRVFKGEKAMMLIEVDQFEIGSTIDQLNQLDNLYQACFFK